MQGCIERGAGVDGVDGERRANIDVNDVHTTLIFEVRSVQNKGSPYILKLHLKSQT